MKSIFYLIYTIIFGSLGILVMTIGGLITLFITLIYKPLFYHMIKYISWIFITVMGIRIKIEGKFPIKGPYIIMANHSSMIDPFIWGIFMKGKFTGIVAVENFKYPIYGALLKKMNAISINRKDSKDAIKRVKQAEEVIKKGIHIGIHPEGTRTTTGKMNSLKKGGFHLAINSKTPILPIGFDGAFKFKPKNRITIQPTKIVVRIGKPIYPNEYNKMDINTLVYTVEKQLKILSGEFNL